MNDKRFDIEKEKCKQIKRLVQNLSGVKDIGHKYQGRGLVDLRKIYCFLSKEYTKASLNVIAEVLRKGYDHATVLHNIKKFNELYGTGGLEYIEVYEIADSKLKYLKDNYSDIFTELEKLRKTDESRMVYWTNLQKIISKGHSIILRQSARIYNQQKEIKKADNIIRENLEHVLLSD